LETLLSKVEELREAPKWTLGKEIDRMPKEQSGKVRSALKKAEKLRAQLVSDLELIVGDGMLVFEEPVVCPPETPGEEPYSFNRIYLAELWDDDECEYEYCMSCDSGYYDLDDSLSPSDLPMAALLEIFNRIEWGGARWFSEEEIAACDGMPEIVIDQPALQYERKKNGVTSISYDGMYMGNVQAGVCIDGRVYAVPRKREAGNH
jgi:hypothetical protein